VPGNKPTIADSLSRRPATEEELEEQEGEVDIDKSVRFQMSAAQARVYPATAAEPLILEEGYSDKYREIALYLSTLQKPPQISLSDYTKLRKKATRYLVEDRLLFRRADKNTPLRRVVDDLIRRSGLPAVCTTRLAIKEERELIAILRSGISGQVFIIRSGTIATRALNARQGIRPGKRKHFTRRGFPFFGTRSRLTRLDCH